MRHQALFSFVGLAVTSASAVIYGAPIIDPVQLLSRTRQPAAILVSLLGLILATLTTNIAANVVRVPPQSAPMQRLTSYQGSDDKGLSECVFLSSCQHLAIGLGRRRPASCCVVPLALCPPPTIHHPPRRRNTSTGRARERLRQSGAPRHLLRHRRWGRTGRGMLLRQHLMARAVARR
jgi:hypothetical protein